jgi:hypothetical protein
MSATAAACGNRPTILTSVLIVGGGLVACGGPAAPPPPASAVTSATPAPAPANVAPAPPPREDEGYDPTRVVDDAEVQRACGAALERIRVRAKRERPMPRDLQGLLYDALEGLPEGERRACLTLRAVDYFTPSNVDGNAVDHEPIDMLGKVLKGVMAVWESRAELCPSAPPAKRPAEFERGGWVCLGLSPPSPMQFEYEIYVTPDRQAFVFFARGVSPRYGRFVEYSQTAGILNGKLFWAPYISRRPG